MKKDISAFTTVLLLLSANCLLPTFAFAQAGSLDLTFGKGGFVTTDIRGYDDNAKSVVLQPDGKIVVAGYSADIDYFTQFSLVRYNTDGTLDNSFGEGGIVNTDIDGSSEWGHSVLLQNGCKGDCEIIVAGSRYKNTDYDFVIVRYHSDGTLDNSFGIGGIVTTDFDGADDIGTSMEIQSDGKIIVAGESTIGAEYNFALTRYNNDGSLDSTFGNGGKVVTDSGNSIDRGLAVALQSDEKIVVAGYTGAASPNSDFAILRYNNNGTLDNSFGTGGIVITDFSADDDWVHSIVIQSDGKILAGGYTTGVTEEDFALVRYNNDGNLDNTFGIGGKIILDFAGNVDRIKSVALQPDGKIVAAGYALFTGSWYDFALVRYNIDGSLDDSFGIDGKVTTDVGSSFEGANSVALQSDGKIVLAGNKSADEYAFDYDVIVLRYNGDAEVSIQYPLLNTVCSIISSPNPFINELKISASTSGKIILFDITCKEVLHQKIIAGENKINTENLSPGFYLLNFFDGNTTENYKIAKL